MSEGGTMVLRGRFLRPGATQGSMEVLEDTLVHIDDAGRITKIEPTPTDSAIPESQPGAVWLPGFVDAHLHCPQTRVIGSATGHLLDWLDTSVFPEEARFADAGYAQKVTGEFCDSMLRWGTTCAAIFTASQPLSADVLFAEMDRRGMRGMVGLTLMDRAAPDDVLVEAALALEASRALAKRWHGHDDRLQFIVTPRFAISCTPALLRGAGDLAESMNLPIQTHLSENRAEVSATEDLFPDSRDYLAVYEDFGLANARSIFAHCIWLDDGQWDRIAALGAAVAHCPDSNFFLGSGCMRLDDATSRGVRVGLGTDVGAGRTFSMRRTAASAYDAGLITESTVSSEALLWRATRGGAQALGQSERIGGVEVGMEADLVAWGIPPELPTDRALYDALVFRHDAAPAQAVYVRGRRLV